MDGQQDTRQDPRNTFRITRAEFEEHAPALDGIVADWQTRERFSAYNPWKRQPGLVGQEICVSVGSRGGTSSPIRGLIWENLSGTPEASQAPRFRDVFPGLLRPAPLRGLSLDF